MATYSWNIIKTIDQGGFGKVHEVSHSVNGQKGALKELMKSSHTANLQRFQTEIKILQNYKHKHIITILDSNIQGNPPNWGPWYVMEYMAGGSLRTKNIEMFKKGLYSQKWTLQNVVFPVLDAIHYAHTHTTHPSYHRDLKPANLLFSEQNHIKVADWGIGKDINKQSIALTVGGMGTPGYCSPEQWFWFPGGNYTVDERTDIYSLGVIFYEMMTGKVPQIFNGNTGQRFSIPTPSSQNHSSISKELDNAILKMMAFEAKDRYQNVQQAKNALNLIYSKL